MRLGIYVSHYETLGHITRITSILDGLKSYKRRVKVLMIHSGKRHKVIDLERYGEVIYLPYSVGRKGLFLEENRDVYNRMINNEGMEVFLKRRLDIVKRILKRFKPDIFLTEYYPFGKEFWSFEIPQVLKYIKENIKSKIISSVGYPNWAFGTNNTLKEFYDGILFHCPQSYYEDYLNYLEEDSPGRKVLSETIRDLPVKAHFTGYILKRKRLIEKEIMRKRLGISKRKRFVMLSRGGGIVNSKIIYCVLGIAKSTPDIYYLVTTGPATTDEEFKKFKRLSNRLNNIKIVKYLPDFEDWLNAADLSISMAGYNTIVRLLWLKKQGIVVPFKTIEQQFRAHYLKAFGSFRILNYESLAIKSLKENVMDMLHNPHQPSPLIDSVDLNGVENTIGVLNNVQCN